MKSIRCGRGLGDSIYLQSVARHLIRRDGQPLEVCSDWPDVFAPLGNLAKVVPFRRQNVSVLAHYATRKRFADTTQFKDCCVNAGIAEPVELKLDWPEPHSPLIDEIKASGRHVVCVQLPRAPMGRSDGYGAELLPDGRVVQKMIDGLKDVATIVQIGAGAPLFKFSGIDIDLANRTTVRELIDIASIADGFLGYCSFMLALAESLGNTSIMMVWARAGLRSRELYLRQITPAKIIEKLTTRHVMDDCTDDQLTEAMHEFLR